MGGILEQRVALAAALAGLDVTVLPYVPTQISPPVVLLDAADPYVDESETFDKTEMLLNLNVYLLVEPAENDTQTDALDQLLEQVLLRTGDWTLTRCSKPFLAAVAGGRYLACRLGLRTPFHLTDKD